MKTDKLQNSSPNFSGVIPIRVYIDGMQTFTEKNMKTAAHQLTKILAGPVKNDEFSLNIARKFARKDPDFDLLRAYEGFKLPDKRKKSTPSDFFRIIRDKQHNRFYLFTGLQGEHTAQLGKKIGIERSAANIRNCPQCFELFVANKNYEAYIKNCLENLKLRITETYNQITRQKLGTPIELNILMKSNKKYGTSAFKTKIEDITFEPDKN